MLRRHIGLPKIQRFPLVTVITSYSIHYTKLYEQHVSVPVKHFTMEKFEHGHAFDGSSIAGWKGIQASDMLLMPDPMSARMDPFTDEPVLNINCDVIRNNFV